MPAPRTPSEFKKLIARIKAYKLEGRSYGYIARKLGLSRSAISGLVYRDKHGFDYAPPRAPKAMPEKIERTYEAPAWRPNDCYSHLRLVMAAEAQGSPYGCGFPVCVEPPARRAA